MDGNTIENIPSKFQGETTLAESHVIDIMFCTNYGQNLSDNSYLVKMRMQESARDCDPCTCKCQK